MTPFIPFKANAKAATKNSERSALWEKMFHMFAYNREDFLAHYHLRSNVESTFSAIKRKFGDTVRAKRMWPDERGACLRS